MTNAANWIVARDKQEYPVADLETLQEWGRTGRIAPQDQIWHPVRGEWVVATDTSELSDLLVRSSTPSTSSVRTTSPLASGAITSPGAAAAGLRAAGYLIDVVPAAILSLLALIPIAGQFFAGISIGCYWLLRDVTGASLGKLILGTRVISTTQTQAGIGARVVRNVPMCIGPFLLAIPLIGYLLAPLVAFVAFAVEVLMLLTQGARLGDKLAGTTVAKRDVR